MTSLAIETVGIVLPSLQKHVDIQSGQILLYDGVQTRGLLACSVVISAVYI